MKRESLGRENQYKKHWAPAFISFLADWAYCEQSHEHLSIPSASGHCLHLVLWQALISTPSSEVQQQLSSLSEEDPWKRVPRWYKFYRLLTQTRDLIIPDIWLLWKNKLNSSFYWGGFLSGFSRTSSLTILLTSTTLLLLLCWLFILLEQIWEFNFSY